MVNIGVDNGNKFPYKNPRFKYPYKSLARAPSVLVGSLALPLESITGNVNESGD